jgi:arginase
MRIDVIAPGVVEATPATPGRERAHGLSHAAGVLTEGGFLDHLGEVGVEVTNVARPALESSAVTDDPIVNLGRFNALVADATKAAIDHERRPVLMGGTCSHLIGMIAGLQQAYGATARIGLVWFDAHGDFNTPRTTHSGMLGGMPVAVSAGLCHAPWREIAGQVVPLPTDRIVFVDVRNLDPEEADLIHATDATIARFGADGSISEIRAAAARLAGQVDHIYLHIDSDVLDRSLQPNHPTAEPNGPDLATTNAAIAAVVATGKVRAYGVVSINPDGPEGEISLASGSELIRQGLAAWASQEADV